MTGWPRTLAWSDFQSISDPGPGVLRARNGHPIVARVAITIMFQASNSPIVFEGGQARFSSVDVQVQLNPSQYVPSRIPAGQTDYYLRHEQGHMDLMGLFARELEVRLLALRAANSLELIGQANPAVDASVDQARLYAINSSIGDCRYDLETNHGMNRSHQDRWNRLIAANIGRWRQADFFFTF